MHSFAGQNQHAGVQNGQGAMDGLKSTLMTMLMVNSMNQKSAGGGGGSTDMFAMMYVFIVTNLVELLFKNAPFVFQFFMKKYGDKISTIKHDLSVSVTDITDNKVKKKTASITVTINVNNADNLLGQAILDFITNNKNTTHVSYIRENFILNQKDVINIEEDIFARMTESTSSDAGSSTNVNSGAGSSSSSSSQGGIVQIIEIYSFTKTTDQLRNFLEDIKQKYSIHIKNKLGNKRYYFNMHPLSVPIDMNKQKDLSRLPPHFEFVMKQFQTNRKFSNLFGEDIDTIRTRVHFFCKNRKWYDEKGIPYTLGLLLSGKPGTGKTSTIKCLANETNRHICNVNLNNDMTKTQLESLFFNETIVVRNTMSGLLETYCIPLDQRIYVLEDVDCQNDIVKERKDKDPGPLANHTNKVDLSFLLNLLDGVLENPGRIIIMTSNFPDTLDSALIRPGRIDVIAKFRDCTNATVILMIEFFYDIILSDMEKTRIRGLKEEILTPAELSKIMFECFSDYKETIQQLETLSEHYVPRIESNNAALSIFDLRDTLRYAPEISPLLRENPRNLLACADAARPDFFANDSAIVTRGITTVNDDLANDNNESSPFASINIVDSLQDPIRSGLDPVANLAMERAAVLPIQTPYYGYEPPKMPGFPIQSYNPNEIGAALYE